MTDAPTSRLTASADSDLSGGRIISSDPAFAGRGDTPAPVICEFCGASRYTRGRYIGDRVFWNPGGAEVCACPEGQALFAKRGKEARIARKKERDDEEARKMRGRVRRVFGNSGMSGRFLMRTFENFQTDAYNRDALKAARFYAEHFGKVRPLSHDQNPGMNGLLISGSIGSGKTHIAAAIANHLLRQGVAVICMSEKKLYGRIKETFSGDGHHESSVLRLYEQAPLLIIDDIGKVQMTEWTISTLYAIIDSRYEAMKPLIVTTNYGNADLVRRLTPPGGDGVAAEAIIDRLVQMCEGIVMNGPSHRRRG